MKEKILRKITKWMDEGCTGRSLSLKYTQYMDKFLADIFHSVDGNAELVLLATGGYGRE
jgi:UTP:GlnB (protein PII) uridylyltransferase